jgi:IS30 family transposase
VVDPNGRLRRARAAVADDHAMPQWRLVTALIKQAKKLPKELYKSLTWDRGKELTDHRRFTLATKIDVYFCDPQSPWQRGSNFLFAELR